MTDNMRFGLDISQHQLSWKEIVSRARFAEELGFDGAWVFDHFQPLYGDPAGPCLEGWSVLAGLAAATQRLRLGSLVTGVTYRHPAILAAQAVTVDHISGGRLDLAMGAAWFEDEHKAFGIPFPPAGTRARMLEEAVLVVKKLMTEGETTLDGDFYTLSGATYNPKPVQDPHPPLWIGASGERATIPIAARHADAWHGFGTPDALRRKVEVLETAAADAGRDPNEIVRSTSLSISESIAQIAERAEGLWEDGFRYLHVSWPEQGRERVEEFVSTVMNPLRV